MLIIFYLALLPILLFSPRHRHIIIVILLFFYAFSDLIDYANIYYGISRLTKILPEILLFGFFLLYLQKRGWRNKNRYLLFSCLFFMLIIFVLSYINGASLSAELLEMRFLFRPILFFIFIYGSCSFSERQFTLIFQVFMIISTIICLIGIYQSFTFDGNYNEVWRYEPLLNAKLDKNSFFSPHLIQYQIIRHDRLRAGGPFYSALDFGFLAGVYTSSCYILALHFRRRYKFSLYFMGIIIGLLACYASEVRTSFILFFLTVIFIFLIKKMKFIDYKKHVILLITLALFMFFMLGFSGLDMGSSAESRLKQFYIILSIFSPFGHGLSAARFDSAFLFFLNSVGIFSFPMSLFIFYIFLPKYLANNIYQDVSARIIYLNSIGILFIMFFQFTIGSYIYNTILILMASFIVKAKKYKYISNA